jgi:integral membrane protein
MMLDVIRWFRGVAVVEAVSYLILLAASVAKHAFGNGGGVAVLGPVHGTIFLVYLLLALNIREQLRWTWGTVGVVAVMAAVPFGAIYVERRLVPGDAELAARDAAEASAEPA